MSDLKLEELHDRLVRMEVDYSYQQETIDTLNEVVTEQAESIDLLKLQVKALRDRLMKQEQQELSTAPAHQPPPHY